MDRLELEGRARRVGDNINTDYIIASTRKKESLDPQVLKRYLLETVDPTFAGSVQLGDLLVAGRNFGCGSAMEVACTVVIGAGIRAVLARSFARTYYRNAVNNGLIPVECDTSRIAEGDHLRLSLADGELGIMDVSQGVAIAGTPLRKVLLDILRAGGLAPYVRANGALRR